MKTDELEKGVSVVLTEIIAYESNSAVSKVLLKKITGMVTIFSVDQGETIMERISPFDTLIIILEGIAEIRMDSKAIRIGAGEVIIIPSHTRNSIRAAIRFKMLTTIIKSGYEEIT